MGKAYFGKATKQVKKSGRTRYNVYKRLMYFSFLVNLGFLVHLMGLTTILHYLGV